MIITVHVTSKHKDLQFSFGSISVSAHIHQWFHHTCMWLNGSIMGAPTPVKVLWLAVLPLFASLAKTKQFVMIVTSAHCCCSVRFLNAHNECLNRHSLVWVSTPPAAFLSKPLQLLFNLGFCVYSTCLHCFVMLLFFTCLSLDQQTVEENFIHLTQKT